MASSRDRGAAPMPRLALRAVVSLAIAMLLVLCPLPVPAARADVSTLKLDPQPLVIVQVRASALGMEQEGVVSDGTARLAIARLAPMAVSADCDPASIQAGISCGMDWMCGLRPCLCGSSDEYGGCSCNGMETLYPDVTFSSSNEDVVRVAQFAGRTWLVPVGAGTATVTCTATLRYHQDATASVQVDVGALTSADAVLVGLTALVVAVVAVLAVGIRRFAKRRKEHDGTSPADERGQRSGGACHRRGRHVRERKGR